MKQFIVTGLILAAITIVLGAFGSHGLKNKLTPEYLEIFDTGVKYQFFHSLGIIIIGLLSFHFPSIPLQIPFYLFLIGIILFSGSLYILAITGIKWFGAVTPIGGLSFIVGWIITAFYIYRGASL